MKRHLLTGALTVLLGGVLLASDASACCHKKKHCAPAPCPAPCAVVEPCPPPPCPPPCPPPKKHCFGGGLKLFKGHGCHKKATVVCVAPPPPCGAVVYGPSAQAMPAGQH